VRCDFALFFRLADAESLDRRDRPRPRVFVMADDEDMEVEKDTGGDSKQRFVVKKWCVHACWSRSRPSCEGAELAACHSLSARIATAA
jgi:hypothetical protein